MRNFPFQVDSRGVIAQLFRYGLVGVVINVAGYMMYLTITYLGGEPKLTMSALYVIVLVTGFLLNRKFTFTHKGSISRAFVKYIIVYGVGYIINLLFLVVLSDRMGFSHQFVQLGAMAFLVFYFFIALRYYTFKH